MSILPYWITVTCPYCGAGLNIHRDTFEYPLRPVLWICEDDEAQGNCGKYFVIKAWGTIEYAVQTLSGE